MKKEDIFNLCSSNGRYVYVDAWVKIVKSDTGYEIEDVDWIISKLCCYDEKDLEDEIKEIEIPCLDSEGFYILRCLFSIEYDSDDYRDWTYLIPEISKFELQVTLAEYEKQQKEWEDLKPGISPDFDFLSNI